VSRTRRTYNYYETVRKVVTAACARVRSDLGKSESAFGSLVVFAGSCMKIELPLFDPSPALMSVELRCVENDFDMLYEGNTHNMKFSLEIARSRGLIRASFLIAKSRALSSLLLSSSSWAEPQRSASWTKIPAVSIRKRRMRPVEAQSWCVA